MMKRQRDICLLYKYASKSHEPIRHVRRYTPRRNREPYVLPRLIIDLDASDSKFVRRWEDMEDEAIEIEDEEKPQGSPRQQNATFTDQQTEKRPDGLRETVFQPRTVTPPDLLAYALLGDPCASPTQSNRPLRELFERCKIHPTDNVATKIQQLTYNFTTDASATLKTAGFTLEDRLEIRRELRSCGELERIHRMISMISSTTQGCRFLADIGDDVVEAIRYCRKTQGVKGGLLKAVPAAAVLELLNNMCLNMESKGVEFGPALANAGLYYSSKAFHLHSTRKYLEIIQSKSYPTDLYTARAVTYLLVNYCRGPGYHYSTNTSLDSKGRREVLKLLTGWEDEGMPQPGEERKQSFASLVLQHTVHNTPRLGFDLYTSYIIGLGYVGASEALWEEWRNPLRTLLLASRSTISDDYANARAEVFAIAFLLAEDPERALATLKSVEQGVNHETQDPRRTIKSKKQRMKTLQLTSRDVIILFYRSNLLEPTDRLLERLRQGFPDGPENTLDFINTFLVREWISQRPRFGESNVHWVVRDGKEGVVVKDDKRKAMYFKPSNGRDSNPAANLSPL